MKKIVSSMVLGSLLATGLQAEIEDKQAVPTKGFMYGIGLDVINGNQQTLRIPFQLESGLVVEGRTKFATDDTNGAGIDFGAGAYYGLGGVISVGGYIDIYDNPAANQTGVRLGGGIKAEQFISKNLSIALEIGYENNAQETTTPATPVTAAVTNSSSTLQPYSTITGRIFF
jgi:hypothetical protein